MTEPPPQGTDSETSQQNKKSKTSRRVGGGVPEEGRITRAKRVSSRRGEGHSGRTQGAGHEGEGSGWESQGAALEGESRWETQEAGHKVGQEGGDGSAPEDWQDGGGTAPEDDVRCNGTPPVSAGSPEHWDREQELVGPLAGQA